MKSHFTVLSVLSVLSASVSSFGCGSGRQTVEPPPTHTLVFGGDLFLARNLNRALFDATARSRILADLTPLFKNADIALVNGEGVISGGGRFTDKGEPRPFMFRAAPEAIDMLKDAGIDVIAVGNNHAADYGARAFIEMIDRLTAAGIGYTGGGENRKDAMTPHYHKVGDVVVAVVGGDLTTVDPLRAAHDRAGPLSFGMNMFSPLNDAEELFTTLKTILSDARRHAHVVLFTPHWGENWQVRPSETIRTIAARVIAMGYDGILGHSAHVFHGVELIDGKPVIYDAGNLVIDYNGNRGDGRGLVWELTFNRAGITRIAGHPIHLLQNRSTPATGRIRDEILTELQKRSAEMNAGLIIENGVARLACDPGAVNGPPEAKEPPKRRRRRSIRQAPSDLIIDQLPADAIPVDVRWEGGVRLVGYQLLVPEHAVPKSGQFVILYFTSEAPPTADFTVHLEARLTNRLGQQVGINIAPHIPGDWILPTRRWPAGRIVKDWTLFRLMFTPPEGEINFYAGLVDGSARKPVFSSTPLENERLVPIGRSTYRKGAPSMFHYLRQHEKRAREIGIFH